ncbi:hypothetical protein CVH10_05800 [Halomonas sp. ND22Bw]|uniref:IclR family transcriptional regulator domain-containing protein n=1 Tax=Halomonas sp. ND22Bw TaxID=2054178 RepID=UPI000D0AEA2B|nr:hypothetical protein CVH10_05800 [Halomonas sp. ND22Bw]
MPKKIRSISRAIRVIEAFNQHGGALSLNQLHCMTQLDRATILRILVTLMEEGWVYRGLGDQRYRLTYQIHELGGHVQPQNELAYLTSPILDAFQKEVIWPSDLAIYNGKSMEIIETTRRQSPLFINKGFMGYRPNMLQSAVGRAYLAWSHPADQAAILKRLRQSESPEDRLAIDESWVQRILQETRERGYGVRDERYQGGPDDSKTYQVRAAAVPVMVMEEVQACISLIWFEALVAPEHLEKELLPKLRAVADQVADEILQHELY